MREIVHFEKIQKPVRVWLFAGVVMVFFQVVIGGVTRLTDSGLSITEWAVIQGTIPPLNEVEWVAAFDKYKVAAKKQFESLHAGMTLSEFKIIFFWEYFHRLWARLMGFVFLFPFLWFLWKRQLPAWLLRRLAVVVGLATLAAVFGWIMVASGLNNDNRTWVSAYKLAGHLAIATMLFGYLFETWLMAGGRKVLPGQLDSLRKTGWLVVAVLFLQILFGGLMAGMRAALIHPYFPLFVEGSRFWTALSAFGTVSVEQVIDYEPHQFAKSVVQLLHRSTAWILSAFIVFYVLKIRSTFPTGKARSSANLLLVALLCQFLLGVVTIINSIGKVPLLWGALHQAGALLLLAFVLFVHFQFDREDVP
jgi:cytochrome c oxidase assembly protein subunit 15